MDKFFVLVTILVIAYSAFHEFVAYLRLKTTNAPNKVKVIAEKLAIVDQYAYPIVASIAVNPMIAKSDSLQAATSIMRDKLQGIGITNVTDDTIKRMLEAAYQQYKQNGGKTNVAENNVADAKIDATLGDAPQSQTPASNNTSTNENKGADNNG